MCTVNCILFGAMNLDKSEIEGKRIIEVGSYNVNGSLRKLIESWRPSQYIGVDVESGPGVDKICKAEDLVKEFGKESFDVIISTELLEHVRDWKSAVSNIKQILKQEGIILITTRSYGFPYHAYPNDFWRYEKDDMMKIFSDCKIITIEKDDDDPGIFIKVIKPKGFIENNLSEYGLYNIIANKKIKNLRDGDPKSIYFIMLVTKYKIKYFLSKLYKFVFKN